MTGKSILITGCSSGIGRDAAQALRARGWHVFASCRQEEDCETLKAQGFDSPRIDYCDAESIASGLAEVLEATGGTLDALFNNGAHQLNARVEDLPTDGLRAIFEANLFGWHELTRQVVPVMRTQGAGRIVQCSSALGFTYMRYRGAYTATKHALEGLTDVMRIELQGTGIHVILIEPGPITTEFRRKGIQYFERYIDWKASARREEYENHLIPRMYGPGSKDRFELPASAVSAKLIRALDSTDPAPRYYVTGASYIAGYLRRILSTRMSDRIISRL